MPVSLVKRYFTAGWSMPGCLPDSPAALFVTLDDARAYLADELDRASDELFELELENALLDYHANQDEYLADAATAHADSASMSASAELIRSDRDGDIRASGGWSAIEPDGYAYWIEPTQL